MAGVNEIFTNDSNDEQVMLDADNTPDSNESTEQTKTTQETAPVEETNTQTEAPVVAEQKPVEAAPAEDALALTKKLQEQVENLNKALYEQRHKVREFKNYVEQVRNQQSQIQKPIVPDFNEAPLEHLKGKTEGAEETLRRIQEEQQTIKAQIETTNVITNIANLENNFRRTVPDYDTAFNYLIDFRKKELALVGITDEDSQINEIRNNSAAISRAALAQGRNPAEVVYELAKQYGYKKSETAPVAQNIEQIVDANKGAGVKGHLTAVQQGQKVAGKTLSNSGSQDTGATYESVLSAKGQDFEKKWAEIFGEY